MIKIVEFERKNQKLAIELNEALEREKELKQLNIMLNQQFEEQNHQLNLLEGKLRRSEQNYQLIKVESEQFKNDFKIEREKFEKEFVKFIEQEHKQTEQHLMKLLDDKQEMCNKLIEELDYLKDRYVNREEVPFTNDDLIKKLESNQLFGNLIKQNDKLNQNFNQLQKSLDEHQVLTESVKRLNEILANLEVQFNSQFSQFNKQLSGQHVEFNQFMETNVVQYIQNLFKSEVEMKLIQVKNVVDELKQELFEFLENYRLPKNNEQEITNLMNQILSKSIKQSSTNSNEELKLNANNLDVKLNEIKEDLKEESNSMKDEKTSLEFDADDLFDERKVSEKEIEIKRIKKIKKYRIKSSKQSSDQLMNQYSDALLNSINQNEKIKKDEFRRAYKDELKNAFKINYEQLKQTNLNQLNYLNSYKNQSFNLNESNQQSKYIIHPPKSKSKSINFNNLDLNLNSINDTSFHKRQIQIYRLEQDISNLKQQLGLFTPKVNFNLN